MYRKVLKVSEQYLITGSEGFIGRNLYEELIKKVGRNNVISVDIKNRESSRVSFTSKINNALFESFDQYHFNFKAIYHLAAISSPVEVERRPLEGIETNLIESVRILEYVRQDRLVRNPIQLVLASSSAVSGNSLYGWTKKATEEVSKYYRQNYPMNIANCRFFNTFGNNENKGDYTSIPTQFLDKAMKDEPIVIYDNGNQSRDFIYIKDLVNDLMSLQKQNNSGVFDFGTGISTSYHDLANLIIRLTNSKSKIRYVKNPLKDYQRYTKANSPYLTPKYTLESALEEMIQDRKVNWRSLDEFT